jgi:hypothetical protein
VRRGAAACACRWEARRCPRGECRQHGVVKGRASHGRSPLRHPRAPSPAPSLPPS